jgi:hypothetical protein
MMELLAKITKMAINKKYITYKDLFYYNEKMLFKLFKEQKDNEFKILINEFETKKRNDIPHIHLPKVKIRDLNPLVNQKRIKL